ncbi:hypothetical protein ACFQQB_66060 [Nonomuraea rubra]
MSRASASASSAYQNRSPAVSSSAGAVPGRASRRSMSVGRSPLTGG